MALIFVVRLVAPLVAAMALLTTATALVQLPGTVLTFERTLARHVHRTFQLDVRTGVILPVAQYAVDGYAYANPVWSPDGSRIAYTPYAGLQLMDADGGNARLLTSAASVRFVGWSADSTRVAYVLYDQGARQLYVTDADDNSHALAGAHGLRIHVHWSPVGHKIAFESGNAIHVADAETGLVEQITENVGGVSILPVWSPDGRSILFSWRSNTGNQWCMQLVDVETRAVDTLLCNQPWDDPRFAYAWSPDGAQIAFHLGPYGARDVYLLDVQAARETQADTARNLTRALSDDTGPVWAPDGRYIAYFSQRAGVPRLVTMHANGSSPRTRTVSLVPECCAVWR